jgi:hypothetical protein
MKARSNWTLLVILSSALLVLIWRTSKKNFETTYSVGLRRLPSKIDPWLSQINSDHLINLNLYYPLISKDKTTGELSSNFLDIPRSRSNAEDFKIFSLCLKDKVLFNDNSAISPMDLKYDIEQFHRYQEIAPDLESAAISGQCVVVRLKKSSPNYFENFTGTASTILKRSTISDAFPVGLGPYRISRATADSIQLERIQRIKHGINVVEFVKVDGVEDARRKNVTDFNYIFSRKDLPEDLYSKYRKIDVMALKSYALVVSIADGPTRKSLSSCVDNSAIAKITGLTLSPTAGFLPKGILGYQVTKEKLNLNICNFSKQKREIPFYNYNPDYTAALKNYFKENLRLFPVKVRVEEHSLKETVEAAFRKTEMMMIVGFDGSGSQAGDAGEAAVYFESFFRKERLVALPPLGLKSAILSALHAENPESKSHFYGVAHELLLRSGYIVPLGQLKLEQYYPATISNIIWGDQIGGYPEYELMRQQG